MVGVDSDGRVCDCLVMPIESKIVLDSVQPDGVRLTTLTITLPKYVLAELNTHRAFCLAGDMALEFDLPVEKMIQRVIDDPVIPVEWGKNQPGMQAREVLSDEPRKMAEDQWLTTRDAAVAQARILIRLGVHKQIVNRLIEPWMYTTVLITATARAYRHFFALRCHPDAQPEMRAAAEAMRSAYESSTPRRLEYAEWHMPYLQSEDGSAAMDYMAASHVGGIFIPSGGCATPLLRKVSVARCARVSYLTQDGKRDLTEDVRLHDRLANSGHWSPFEHVAQAVQPSRTNRHLSGNFQWGWVQLRKTLAGEYTE